MKVSSLIVLRPVCFFIILALVMLLLPSLLFPFWIIKAKTIQREVKLISLNVSEELPLEIENIANLLLPKITSATTLATLLSSSLNGIRLSFSNIETKVAPILFQALLTIPQLSQISYTGLDGLFFSYYTKANQSFAVYSNNSFSVYPITPNATTKYTWYTQPVNQNTGRPFGEAVISHPWFNANASWIQEALNSTNGYSSIGMGWNGAKDLLFLRTAGVDGRGAISLGFPVESLVGFFSSKKLHGGSLYLATKDGKVLTDGIQNTHMVLVGNSVSFQMLKPNGDHIGNIGNVTCEPYNGTLKPSVLDIWERKYMFFCSPIEIVGLQSVYALALPHREQESIVHKNIKFAFMLLVIMICTMVISIVTFVFLIVRAARREMHLCSTLIRQMESTQQAERKSMNKSLAFASASHDVRASLAGITGLIDICRDEVAPGSEFETNLMQMEVCIKDLLGLLNSILDTSKIEAGKMQLEEEEFDLAKLLEDAVDLYYPVGMKKGVDVVLDPCDGSISNNTLVKGDRGKLKQILCNLVSNAIKFTPEGHVAVRAWAKKPSFKNSILGSNRNRSLSCISCLFFKNNEAYNDLEAMNTIQQNPNSMEFVFEVDDTGKGIPKEKQNSVFENYVQVKETALGQGGTGLGLGIVQSLVRLMGGEIRIVDKEIGEKGTVFSFNAFLTTCGINSSSSYAREGDVKSNGGSISSYMNQHSEPSNHRSPSPIPKPELSQVILFIQSYERQRTSQKFMESLGIKVCAVKQWEQLPHTFKKIKHKLNFSRHSSSGRSDVSMRSDCMSRPGSHSSSIRAKDLPLSALDGTDQIPPLHRRISYRAVPNFILIVIDTNAGPFRELSKAVAEFRRDLYNTCCRVVWIDKPGAHSIHLKGLNEEKLPPTDLIISKPLHGSRLYHLIGLLPEFGGTLPGDSTKSKYRVEKVSSESGCSESHARMRLRNSPTQNLPVQRREIQEHVDPSREKRLSGKNVLFAVHNLPIQRGEIQEHGGTRSDQKPLSGKKVLVAEDNTVMSQVVMSNLSKLGAAVEHCKNGKAAFELVCKGLSDQRTSKAFGVLPYDYILMDCEMPVMDGFEATRRIREEETQYGVHVPIIALTAHTIGEEAERMMRAGMDFHLPKPLKKEQLLEAITYIHSKI
ncbi:histidine kinase CKI1-like [Cornus florida]|uniref:histidine kinase CKI1-like n=1 Tax=Cornus florida TaxID=4283 RepID=UPI00289D8553|nr:histidine kinase CKI1-like [Cornus florida]